MCFGLSRRSRSLTKKEVSGEASHGELDSLQRGIKGVDFGHRCGLVMMIDAVDVVGCE